MTSDSVAPQWLDDDEQRAWRAYIYATNRVRQELERRLLAEADMSIEDFGVLVALSEGPDDGIRMAELSERFAIAPSRLTYRIDRMADAGLVERRRCPEDRRGSYAVVTPAGMERLTEAAAHHVTAVREHLVDHLDRAAFLELGRLLEPVAEAHGARLPD